MNTVIYAICACIFLGGFGMWLSNKKVDKKIARGRWIKYFSYLIIMGIVITSISLKLFAWLPIVIAAAGYYELAKAINNKKTIQLLFRLSTVSIYSFIAVSFIALAFWAGSKWWMYLYMQVLVFDAFCQITGQLFGKRKLVPGISPSKTIEGFIGGSFFCILIAVLISGFAEVTIPKAVLFGVITCISSLSGDLLASWVKRKTGIKDFSNLLPGQGGVLDRFDSLIMTGAVYCMMTVTGLFSFILNKKIG